MRVEERFLKYVSFPTAANEESESSPSTQGQTVLGRYLVEELHGIGVENARIDEFGYVYASLPATADGYDSIGLVAHMDTSPAASGENIKARVVNYLGGDIVLNTELNIKMTEKEYPVLKKYVGGGCGR